MNGNCRRNDVHTSSGSFERKMRGVTTAIAAVMGKSARYNLPNSPLLYMSLAPPRLTVVGTGSNIHTLRTYPHTINNNNTDCKKLF